MFDRLTNHTLANDRLKAAPLWLALIAFLASTNAARGQTIIYVNASRPPGSGSGTSWATAYSDLTVAMNQVNTMTAGQSAEIWVAEGTYVPGTVRDFSFPTNSRTFYFSSTADFVTIYGGFVGTETAVNQRPYPLRPTILSGDMNGNDSTTGDRTDNAYHILTRTSGGSSIFRLDGLTFRGGNANGNGATSVPQPGFGGALYSTNTGTIRVAQCVFEQNVAASGGAAIYMSNRVDLDRCIVRSNNGPGAIYVDNGASDITNTLIHNNTQGLFVRGIINNPTKLMNSTVAYNSTGVNCVSTIPAGLNVVSSILWGNGSGTLSQQINVGGQWTSFSIVQGASTSLGFNGQGMQFPPANGPVPFDANFIPTPTSLALNTGFNQIPSNDRDVRGAARAWSSNGLSSGTIDIGALEYNAPIPQRTIYVRPGATGTGTGESWANAMTRPKIVNNRLVGDAALQVALRTAYAFPTVVSEIWVARGMFIPADSLSPSESAQITRSNLALYAGLAGIETSVLQRPALPSTLTDALDPTKASVLTGDLNSDDLGSLNRSDNVRQLLLLTNVGPAVSNVFIDGFTLASASGGSSGGALAIGPISNSTFRNLWFVRNSATDGGAVSIASSSGIRFENCSFAENLASNYGGGIHFSSGTTLSVRGCTFDSNRAHFGSAVASLVNGATIDVVSSDFTRNSADVFSNSSATIAFSGNNALLRVLGSRFHANRAPNYAVFNIGGGTSAASTALIANSQVIGNVNDGGGAISAVSANLSVINSAVLGNVTTDTADSAGIRFIPSGVTTACTVANSILRDNSIAGAATEQAQIYVAGGSPQPAVTIAGNDVTGWSGSLGGIGNNSLNPLFTRDPSPGADLTWGTPDDDFGDLRLSVGSPAIDSGDAALLPLDTLDLDTDGNTTEVLPIDIAGLPRLVDDPAAINSGPGAAPHVDRGPNESQVNCTSCPGPRSWRLPMGGSWDDPASWTPSVPSVSHDTLFDLGSTFVANLVPPPVGVSTRTAKSMTVSRGNVTLDLNQTTLALSESDLTSLIVGNRAQDAASLTITDGELRAFESRVATDPTQAGISSVLNVGSGGRFITSSSLVVGFQGSGRMNISSGGRVTSRDATIGDQAGSSGYVSVSGLGSTWDIPFFLIIDNGELNVSNSGTVNVGTGIPFTGIFLLNDGRVSGNGNINGNVVNFGRIAPGNSPGTLTINGGYAQVGEIQDLGAFSGRLEVEIAGAAPGQFDKLDIRGGGEVVLGGGMFVTFAPGFQPAPADTFEMITAQGPIGSVGTNTGRQFDVIFFPALTAPNVQSKFLRASYSGLRGPGNGVTVSVADLPVNAGFNPPASTSLTTAPEGAAIGDLDADGDLDLAIALPASGNVNGSIALLLNNGSGGFAVSQISSGGIEPRGVAIANIDNVNGNDLAIANAGSDQVRVLRRQPGPAGTANFGDPAPITIQLAPGSRPIAIAARDLDRPTASDTIDLMTANEGGGGDATGSISVMRNVGGSTPFQTTPTTSAPTKPNTRPTNIRPFNPNQDKDLDVAVTTVSTGGAGALMIFSNVGSQGIFSPGAPNVAIPIDAGPAEIAAGVLSPGGASIPGTAQDEDLVIVNRAGQSVSVLRNTGTFDEVNPEAEPGFAPAVSYTIASGTTGLSSDPRSIVLSDIDNDGDLDIAAIATATPTQRVIKVLRNDSTTQSVPGVGTVRQVAFAQIADRTSGDCPRQVLAGDVTGDGRADLVTVNTTCDRGPLLGSVSLNSNTLPPLSVSVGACCAPASSGGTCELLTHAECLNRGHAFQGAQVACGPTLCPQPAAACCRGSSCVVLDSVACLSVSQSRYAGAGTVCNAPGNLATPCCKADYNQSSMVSVQDIFDFLSGWFAGDFAKANFNGDTSLSVQDLFDFLAAWFAGC